MKSDLIKEEKLSIWEWALAMFAGLIIIVAIVWWWVTILSPVYVTISDIKVLEEKLLEDKLYYKDHIQKNADRWFRNESDIKSIDEQISRLKEYKVDSYEARNIAKEIVYSEKEYECPDDHWYMVRASSQSDKYWIRLSTENEYLYKWELELEDEYKKCLTRKDLIPTSD